MPCGREYTPCHVRQGVYSVRSLGVTYDRYPRDSLPPFFYVHHLQKRLDVNETMHAALTC